MKRADYLIMIIFITLLYIPSLVWLVYPKEEMKDANDSKQFSFVNIEEFPKQFESYYDDVLPFKNMLREIWSDFNYNVFNESINQDVIVGKNDGNKTWLFYNSKTDGDPLSFIGGIKQFKEKELSSFGDSMIYNTEVLKEKNIDLYYMLIPNKSTVYKDKLPSNIGFVNSSTSDSLYEYMLNNKQLTNFIYIKEALIKARNNYDTFYMTDTHWNQYGAYIGVMELIRLIEQNDRNYCKDMCNNYDINVMDNVYELKYESKDLNRLLGVSKNMADIEVDVSNFVNDKAINRKDTSYDGKAITEFENDDSLYDKRVLFIGDSFRKGTYDYLPRIFTNVYYVHISDYDKSMIDYYNPSIIIFETVERYSNRLIKKIV